MKRESQAEDLRHLGRCPDGDKITREDVRNMPLYTWLLIVEEDGASLDQLASEVLYFDLSRDRDRAIRETISYLRRARWIHDLLCPTIEQRV